MAKLENSMLHQLDTEIIAEGLHDVASSLRQLGINGASTPMGAIEVLSIEIKDAGASIAEGLYEVARALDRIADAINERSE